MAGVSLHVAVVGPTLHKGNLAPHLPKHWRVTQHRQVEVGDPDILVLLAPSDAKVRDARRRRPDTVILVVLSLLDAAESVVEVLDAGADACVRTDAAGVVATHVRACRRRQLVPLSAAPLATTG
jgi:DNA-binding response OmpR family regulator